MNDCSSSTKLNAKSIFPDGCMFQDAYYSETQNLKLRFLNFQMQTPAKKFNILRRVPTNRKVYA